MTERDSMCILGGESGVIMKTLLLIRHAKSSWDIPSLVDEARPLNERGKRDAPEMGRRLARRGIEPDAILSSPAVRARTTAELIARELDADETLVVDHRLYATSADGLLEVIRAQDDSVGCLLVVGHNPEMDTLARRFSPLTPPMSTCAVLELHFDVNSWPAIRAGALLNKRYDAPKLAEV
ncbi:phosphohistidine phosphatase [Microterricola gilva]|uniref:Phosphohistidine phosphatase n=1 Tax=Microterricola gilva TaxID=393267 RepID=A0A4Q8AHP6_9MICO|nr:histidine phosphatase family protein [Microterricola gilva]RZU63922.1 phosphohistidine phosphatase [Microterricola gilva]